MNTLSPVVWSEGMHLAQHHFQAQSRYFEGLTAFALRNLFFRTYGLAACQLDAEALLNGTVVISHAHGIMPDGLPFHFPEDASPPPLEIGPHFSPVQDAHRVLLAIPPYRLDRANVGLNGEAESLRFVSSLRAITDELTGADEKTVGLARKNFRLLLDDQDTGELVTLPIARVRRDRQGRFVYDSEYIPPCLKISASARLMDFTGRLVELLNAKADSMRREREASQRPLAEWAAREIANFWFTHAINSAAAPLQHLLRMRSAHPEQLYVEVARLVGALCTFALDADPSTLPAYDHDDPGPCFAALERQLRQQLEMVVPTNTTTINLAAGEPSFFRGQIADPRALATSTTWYLGLHSSAGRAELADSVPRLVKLCSGEHIVRLVKEGLPGLPLEYEPSPPSAISPRPGWHYFRVQSQGPCWTLVAKTSQVGVYAPAAIPDVQLEFTIVLESQ